MEPIVIKATLDTSYRDSVNGAEPEWDVLYPGRDSVRMGHEEFCKLYSGVPWCKGLFVERTGSR